MTSPEIREYQVFDAGDHLIGTVKAHSSNEALRKGRRFARGPMSEISVCRVGPPHVPHCPTAGCGRRAGTWGEHCHVCRNALADTQAELDHLRKMLDRIHEELHGHHPGNRLDGIAAILAEAVECEACETAAEEVKA